MKKDESICWEDFFMGAFLALMASGILWLGITIMGDKTEQFKHDILWESHKNSAQIADISMKEHLYYLHNSGEK